MGCHPSQWLWLHHFSRWLSVIAPPSSKAQHCAALLGLWQPPRRIMTNPGRQHTARRQRCCTRMVLTRAAAWCWMASDPSGIPTVWLRAWDIYVFTCIHDLSVYLCVSNGRSFIVAFFFEFLVDRWYSKRSLVIEGHAPDKSVQSLDTLWYFMGYPNGIQWLYSTRGHQPWDLGVQSAAHLRRGSNQHGPAARAKLCKQLVRKPSCWTPGVDPWARGDFVISKVPSPRWSKMFMQ